MKKMKKSLKNCVILIGLIILCFIYFYWYNPNQYFSIQHPTLSKNVFLFTLLFNHVAVPLLYFSFSALCSYILRMLLRIKISPAFRFTFLALFMFILVLYVLSLLVLAYRQWTINFLAFFPVLKIVVIISGLFFSMILKNGDE